MGSLSVARSFWSQDVTESKQNRTGAFSAISAFPSGNSALCRKIILDEMCNDFVPVWEASVRTDNSDTDKRRFLETHRYDSAKNLCVGFYPVSIQFLANPPPCWKMLKNKGGFFASQIFLTKLKGKTSQHLKMLKNKGFFCKGGGLLGTGLIRYFC